MDREPVWISALEHFVYCSRQCALIHVDGVWIDNVHTVRGQAGHRRVDDPGSRTIRGVRVVRAVPLFSERLNLSGRADAVEVHDDGRIVPVEYKIGTRHGNAAHVQLCAQAMCLEEMLGVPVPKGAIWFGGPRRRLSVSIDEALREETLDVISAVNKLLENRYLPSAPDDERCEQCQLIGHCLPDIVSHLLELEMYMERMVFECAS